MAFAWACCLAVFLWVMDLMLGWAGMEDTQQTRGVSFEVALRIAEPAETIAAAAAGAAADTEKIVAQVWGDLFEMVQVVEPPGTCLVVGGFGIVDQKAYTDSGGAETLQEQAACNKRVVEWVDSHLMVELGLAGVLQAVAEEQFDEEEQELTAGCLYQMHYQLFYDLLQKVKICPHWTVNGLRTMILSEQVEAWLALSASRLTLACLLKFVLTCEPT